MKDPRIESLISEVAEGRQAELLADMVETVLRFGADHTSVADLKLYSRAMRELRYSSKIFSQYQGVPKVAVFGSARVGPETAEYQAAREFARRMVEHGYMVITGGGDGIMGAAQEGAGAEKSFGLNIRLPFEQRANETIEGDPKLINFRYFFTRKLHFVKETHAFVLFPGGFGTQDEGFEVLTLLQTGKSAIAPLVLLDRPNGHYWETWRRFVTIDLLGQKLVSPSDFSLFRVTHSIDEAVEEILHFYRHFHSYRWVGERMVIRLRQKLAASAVERLNTDFASLLAADRIVQGDALPEEGNEPKIAHLPRLILTPYRHDFGALRMLINAINAAPLAD